MVVIGAGLIGLTTAQALAERYNGIDVAVVDQEDAVAIHQTGHNSGVIHSGVYYRPSSLKAQLCVAGARAMYEFCAEEGVEHERCGKIIVARASRELELLTELERRGHANGVEGLRRLEGDEIAEIEPAAVGLAALHIPGAGIVDYRRVARALEHRLRASGVTFVLGTRVDRVDQERGRAVVRHAGGTLTARRVIACAGLWSDRLARRSGAPADPRIVPFRGAYLRVVDPAADLVRGMIYPVPDPRLPFLGIHITRHIDGDLLLGPTALLVGARDAYRLSRLRPRDLGETLGWPGTWRVARRFWRTGLSEIAMAASARRFVNACAEYMPALRGAGVERAALSGIRAQAVSRSGRLVDDFEISPTAHGLHVRNAPSPAATSSFAIGRMIADRLDLTDG